MCQSQQFSQISNNWYFGSYAGITFDTSPPSYLLDGQMNTQEGVASISNEDGILLFYTDGKRVWDRSHTVMLSGSLNGHESSSQSAIILPNLANRDIYYIFTVDELAGSNGLQYSELDVTLPGNGTLDTPLGDLVTGQINKTLVSPISEKITAVLKADNSGYWIIVHGWNNDEFYVFSTSCQGVDITPITINVGEIHGGGINNINAVGYLKSSIDRMKIAIVNRRTESIEVYDFDAQAGMISNMTEIKIVNESLYGVEFTFDSNYLLIGGRQSIYRYDLESKILSNVPIQNIGQLQSDNVIRALQLGPDKNIYVSIRYLGFLSTIENPSDIDAFLDIDFINLSPSNSNRSCRFGLPNIFYFDFYQKDTLRLEACVNELYEYNGQEYAANSINEIFVESNAGCDSSYILKIEELTTFESFVDTMLCKGEIYTFNGEVVLAGISQSFSLIASNGCDSVVNVFVDEVDLINVDFSIDLCEGDQFIYRGEVYYESIDTFISITSASTCDSLIHFKIKKIDAPEYFVDSSPSCENKSVGSIAIDMLAVQGGIFTYSIDNEVFQTEAFFGSLKAGMYTVYIKIGENCIYESQIVVDEILAVNHEDFIFVPNVFYSGSNVGNDCFQVFKSNDFVLNDYKLSIYDRWGSKIFISTDINQCWNGEYKNELVEEGVYVWVLEIIIDECNEDKIIIRSGDISLLK